MPDSLRTQRLTLRRWTDEDRAPFAELNADPEVMRFFPTVMTKQESDAMVDRIEHGFEQNGFGLWAVEIDGRFAGLTGLNRTSFETPMGPHVEIGWFAGLTGLNRTSFETPMGPHVEIGWRFASWAWGHGYASEAATRVLAAAFEDFGLSEVYSFTTETNANSEAVMKRIGMTRRADLDFDHPNTPGWWGAKHIVYRIDSLKS